MENDDGHTPVSRLKSMRVFAWPATCVALLLLMGATRFYDLGARPLHHDEGVNGIFMRTLVQDRSWTYDPQNYHGPTLFFFQYPPALIASAVNDGWSKFNPKSFSGLTPVALRSVIAVVGIALLLSLLLSCTFLGRLGAAAACVFAGLSCDLIFFSRYFIHESYVVLFTYLLVFGAWRFHETRRSAYAYLVAIVATLMFCTKETALFHFVVLGLAWFCAGATHALSSGERVGLSWKKAAAWPRRLARELGGVHTAVIVVLCTLIWATLFTSFFHNWKGPIDSLRSYFYWGHEGVESGHNKPFLYFFSDILLPYEPVGVMFALVGAAAAFIRNDRRGLFITFWMLGMSAVYSLIPYKTPWLVVNMSLPMAVVAGYGVQAVYEEARRRLPPRQALITLSVLGLFSVFLLAAQTRRTFRVNYIEYDNDRHPQVYAHTVRQVKDILGRIDAASVRGGRTMEINVFSDIYWPLPLYLIRYPATHFWGGRVADVSPVDADVLIVSPKMQAEVDRRLKGTYSIRRFDLRAGVPLLLYINGKISGQAEAPLLPLLTSVPAPKTLVSGLKLEAFKGNGFAGKADVVPADASFNFSWNSDAEKKYSPPFSLRWTGLLHVEKEGIYRFALESDDGSWLTIDDKVVIDNGGDHPLTRLTRDVRFSAGYHKVEIRYYDILGEATLRVAWAPPGEAEGNLPRNVVFEDRRP